MTCRRHRESHRLIGPTPMTVTDEDRRKLAERRELLALPCGSVWEGARMRCGLREGHDGDHQAGPFKWDDEHAASVRKGDNG